jgi:FKBP-type peptidyl-prolyl cis-trans isomerase FkpA
LGDDELNQALIASESQVTNAREKTIAEQAQKGESYLAIFKKGKAVKSTTAGAWYRVDYAGDAPIPEGASLDVVVKETLTNGTVIQDMEAKGAVLTQTLDKFPPLFQEALKTLRNHGSLTLVVPPQLAYGDKGYPPNVPPNATMVYTLRVAEMYPQAKK